MSTFPFAHIDLHVVPRSRGFACPQGLCVAVPSVSRRSLPVFVQPAAAQARVLGSPSHPVRAHWGS